MIKRILANKLLQTAKYSPIIGVVGPRQSGKTTLTKTVFPKYRYVNLEDIAHRRHAHDDPRGFLSLYDKYVILDEVQRVPELFSALMVKTDIDKIPGQYILTGSQHFLMLDSITQSLAGRIILFNLLPLSLEELQPLNSRAVEYIWRGGYPRVYDSLTNTTDWLDGYIRTYLDRDVSLLTKVTSLETFEKFIHILAGRTGQLLNLSSLGSDVGISHNTAKEWINLMLTSGIIHLLPPYYANISKRLIKSPKIYFLDTGLACRLLGIQSSEQLPTHPLYGALFETLVVSEMLKHCYNRGENSNLYFWRDSRGLEADIYVEKTMGGELYEVKSAQTLPGSPFTNLNKIKATYSKPISTNLIYGGEETYPYQSSKVISWKSL